MRLDSDPVLDERTPTASLACSNRHAMDRPAPVVLLTYLNQTNFIVSCPYTNPALKERIAVLAV